MRRGFAALARPGATCLLLLGLAAGAPALAAQAAEPPPLSFLGFTPGAPASQLKAHVADLGGRLSCRTAAADARVGDCRGSIPDPVTRQPLEVIVSLVADSTALLLVSGPVGTAGVDRWGDALREAYGDVAPRARGGQRTWQWVRTGRMIRLTTRREGGAVVASVSLVHGPLLDRLGNPGPPR